MPALKVRDNGRALMQSERNKPPTLLVFLAVFFVAASVTDLSGIFPPQRLEDSQKSGAILEVYFFPIA